MFADRAAPDPIVDVALHASVAMKASEPPTQSGFVTQYSTAPMPAAKRPQRHLHPLVRPALLGERRPELGHEERVRQHEKHREDDQPGERLGTEPGHLAQRVEADQRADREEEHVEPAKRSSGDAPSPPGPWRWCARPRVPMKTSVPPNENAHPGRTAGACMTPGVWRKTPRKARAPIRSHRRAHAAVDEEHGAVHERRVVRCEEHRGASHVGRLADPADRRHRPPDGIVASLVLPGREHLAHPGQRCRPGRRRSTARRAARSRPRASSRA